MQFHEVSVELQVHQIFTTFGLFPHVLCHKIALCECRNMNVEYLHSHLSALQLRGVTNWL